MAIQAQFYPSNGGPPFCDNGYCGGGLVESCFSSQQKLLQQQQLQQRLQQFYDESQRPVDPNHLVYNSIPLNSPPSFAFQFEKQGEEIDQYIRLQNEKLRYMLQKQAKQQAAALVKKLESHSLKMLREKDEEIAQASKKRAELEEFLTRLEAENQAWQKVAQENEAMALSLYRSLEEMKERGCYNNNDAESCCEERDEEGTGENRVGGEFEQITREMMLCKSCHSRSSCFLFLPCRHLSSCKACDAFLKACPVCRMPKKASIETLIF